MQAATLTGRPNRSDPAPTLLDFIQSWQERTENDLSLAPGSKLRRDIALKALLKTWPGLASLDPRLIREADCRRWAVNAFRDGTGFVAPRARTRRRGMSPSAFNKCVDALRGILAIAEEEGVVSSNPANGISKVRDRRPSLELPSPGQFEALVGAVARGKSRWAADCADFVRLLAYSGARLREATALQWRHVDDARRRLTIPGTKSESSHRVIPIFPPLAGLLLDIRSRRPGEPREAAISRVRECRQSLRSACRAVGVPPLTHHDLRHLFATRCIESGVDIPTVSRWLGHSDGGVLAMKTYGHLSDEHSALQAAKVRF
jgi:integrase